jgi:hypothetical protein
VSAFVQHAAPVALDDVAVWGALLAEALRSTGGPLTDEERAWADEVLGLAAWDRSRSLRRPTVRRGQFEAGQSAVVAPGFEDLEEGDAAATVEAVAGAAL